MLAQHIFANENEYFRKHLFCKNNQTFVEILLKYSIKYVLSLNRNWNYFIHCMHQNIIVILLDGHRLYTPLICKYVKSEVFSALRNAISSFQMRWC